MQIFILILIASINLHGLICPINPEYESKITVGKVQGVVHQFEVWRIPFRDRDDNHLWMNPEAVESFMEMVSAANKDGLFIQLNSAHRTPKHQRRLWLQMPEIAGHPDRGGDRSHQTGHSVDVAGTTYNFSNEYILEWEKKNKQKMDFTQCDKHSWGYKCPTVLYWWLRKNARFYGFENDVESERWHWTYTQTLKEN